MNGQEMASEGAARNAPVLSDFLSGTLSSSNSRRLYLVVLNWNLPSFLPRFWDQAAFRVCADGGANRLYDLLPSLLPGLDPSVARAQFLPDTVRGDLDSLRAPVREFYQAQGVEIADLSADQDSTDLQKCVSYIEQRFIQGAANPQDHEILALGALGGRLDHTLAHLNILHMFPHLRISLLGDGNLVRLLQPGTTHVHPDRRYEGPTCGLVPLRRPALVTTAGLRWNCEQLRLQIGGMVSTSNVLEADEVVVDSDGDLIWSTEVNEEKLLQDFQLQVQQQQQQQQPVGGAAR